MKVCYPFYLNCIIAIRFGNTTYGIKEYKSPSLQMSVMLIFLHTKYLKYISAQLHLFILFYDVCVSGKFEGFNMISKFK